MPETERERLARYIYEMTRLYIPGDTLPAKLDAFRDRLSRSSVKTLREIAASLSRLIEREGFPRRLPVDL
jgi:hypothetical protein